MAQVRIRHVVSDFVAWKQMFDADPLDRRASGVRRFRVSRDVENPGLVSIDLEFDTVPQALAMRDRLITLWTGPAGQVLDRAEATVVDTVESVEL